LTAATRKRYAVPSTKPVTVADAVVEVLVSNVSQVEPLSEEYSTV
jgi:hypothetical protein